MRAVIYARYSSDQQRAASIEDQIRVCTDYAKTHGFTVTNTYTDYALSGATTNRPGLQSLLQDSQRGTYDIVLAEALDRVSRDQEDIAGIYKRLNFQNIKLITLAEGEINQLHVGLKGTMNSLFLQDLADKTRRGMRGRLEQGKSGGGNAYGYKVIHTPQADGTIDRGTREIIPAEAAIITEIFERYANGMSPRDIAKHLNDRGIPGPSSKTSKNKGWGQSTINGNASRGTGILNNELYIGRLIWNRLSYRKDPETGKRVSRLNPESEWHITDVPELRIISDELWQRVKDRQLSVKRGPNKTTEAPFWDRRRPRHLLSGLVTCGCCGGGYTAVGRDYLGCASSRNKGTCDNKATIKRGQLEDIILDGLRNHLMDPEYFKAFCDAFTQELNALNKAKQAQRHQKEAELHKVERQLGKALDAITEGLYSPALKDRIHNLEAQKVTLTAELANTPEAAPILHPNMSELYRRKIAQLTDALNAEDTKAEAFDLIRTLIDSIVLTPMGGEMKVELTGSLAGILSLCSTAQTKKKVGGFSADDLCSVKLVAGARFELTTFRL